MMKEQKKHTKHTALTKPLGGAYHSNEWGIIGAPCSIITQLAQAINDALKPTYKVGYLDAAHQAPEKSDTFYTTYMDKIAFQSFETYTKPQQKQHRKFFNELDLLIVNGNHFKADKQIVLINEKKKESLHRKLDRLTDIRLVLVEKEGDAVHDYLHAVLDSNIPIVPIDKIEVITKIILDDFMASIPSVHGLVLAGGKSTRMGKDKGMLQYHDQPHREYLAGLLNNYCDEVFLSFRKAQSDSTTNYSILLDTFEGLGPYGAILSAFRAYPNHAWLTVACDLPYLNDATIQQLISSRNPSKLATCFHNPETQFPEPLITIWEPRAYPVLLSFLSQGYSCPRKVLINTEVEEIHLEDTRVLFNANAPEDYEKAKAVLSTDAIPL